MQTIWGNYLRSEKPQEPLVPHVVPLGDGDSLILHLAVPQKETEEGAQFGVLLMHGLGGTHQSGYVQRAAKKLLSQGFWVAIIDHRGCGAGQAHAKYPTHAGRSADVAAAAEYLLEKMQPERLLLVGYSLSGNMLLKWLAEAGNNLPAEVCGMAVCPPVDLIACSEHIEQRRNWIYNQSFCKNLLATIQRRTREFPDAHTMQFRTKPRSLREFDAAFTAPLGGFSSVEEYYTRSSSAPHLERITCPTLILAAGDDPIVPAGPLRTAKFSRSTQFVETPGGGHLGYLSRGANDPDQRWMDWRVVDFAKQQFQMH